jgi:hypothetical protein
VLSKVGLALTSAVLIGGLACWTWWAFDHAHGDAETKLAAAVLVAKGHAARSLSAIDGTLASIVEPIDRDGLDALRTESQWQRLRQFASRLPETGEAFVFDEAGDQIAATPFYPAPAGNISDREWFSQLKSGHHDVYIGRALKGRSVHHLFFPVARAIYGANHAFNGAVQIGVEVSYVAQLFRDLGLDPGTDVGLYRGRRWRGDRPPSHDRSDARLTQILHVRKVSSHRAPAQ